jgi:hypothetical protein
VQAPTASAPPQLRSFPRRRRRPTPTRRRIEPADEKRDDNIESDEVFEDELRDDSNVEEDSSSDEEEVEDKTKLKTVKRRRWVLEDRDDCAQRLANDSSNKKSSASVSIQWHPRHTPPQAAVIFDSNPDFVPRRYSFVAADYVPQACCSVHSRAASGCKKHMNHFIITFATNSHEINAITPTPDATSRCSINLDSMNQSTQPFCTRNSFPTPAARLHDAAEL